MRSEELGVEGVIGTPIPSRFSETSQYSVGATIGRPRTTDVRSSRKAGVPPLGECRCTNVPAGRGRSMTAPYNFSLLTPHS